MADHYQSLTEEFHRKVGIDDENTRENQLLWVSMLTEEVGELAETINKDRIDDSPEELADVVVIAFGMAKVMGIDLRVEFTEKMEYNMKKSGKKSSGGKVMDDAE